MTMPSEGTCVSSAPPRLTQLLKRGVRMCGPKEINGGLSSFGVRADDARETLHIAKRMTERGIEEVEIRARAFSSKVDTGLRRENATKQRDRAPFRFKSKRKRL